MEAAGVSDFEHEYTRHMFPHQPAVMDDLDSEDDLDEHLQAVGNGPPEELCDDCAMVLDPFKAGGSGLQQLNGSPPGMHGRAEPLPVNGSPIAHSSKMANTSPVAHREADRFGFFGGKQFTNPEK